MTPELLAILIAAITGAGLALWLDRRAAGSLLAGEALLLGVAAAAGSLLVLSFAGVPWSRTALTLAMFIIGAIGWTMAFRARAARIPAAGVASRHPAALLLYAFTIVLIAGYATLATTAPLWEFDFIGDWGLKARAFFAARSIDWTFLEHPFHYDVHPDYPPLLPLAFDGLALARNGWNDQTLGILSVVLAVGLLLALHRLALEETGSSLGAALVVLAMVPFACSPWIGLAEGPLVAYATTGLLLIRRGSVTPGAVMLGLAASTKNEGLTFIAAAAIALAVSRRLRDIPRLWPAVLIPMPWLILRHVHSLQTDLAEGSVLGRMLTHLRDPRPLLAAFVHFSAGKPFYWLALVLGLLIAVRTLVKRERFVLVALALQFAFYIGAYLITPHDIDWHVRWSLERLISHLTPALTYVVLVVLVRGSDQ